MAIINLGQLGQRRESGLDFSKYTDALAKAKSEQAKGEQDREDKTRSYLREAYKNYWKTPDRERQLFDNTPEGKEFHKLAKKHITEWYDKEGKPIRYPVEQEPWEPRTREEQLKFKEDTEAAMQKVKSNTPLTAQDAATITTAVDIMIYRKAITPEAGQQILGQVSKLLQNRFSGAIAGDNTPANINPNDPAGILGK